jgi:hypothetical protein
MKEKGVFAVNINRIKKVWNQGTTRKIAGGLLAVLALSGVASAQQKKDEITFDLIPNPAVIDCLRANSYEEPRAKATVMRGKLNDTLILDLDGIKPGLDFDLFTVEHSPFFVDGSKNPSFNGSFGLAWYQSDVEVGKRTDDGHVRIKTILLDQIFGFDPDVKLPPTNTFHVGFWFNNPEDAAALPSCHFDPTKPTPFNGEHKAGPFAMISGSDLNTKLGPLCTDPNDSTKPASCNP